MIRGIIAIIIIIIIDTRKEQFVSLQVTLRDVTNEVYSLLYVLIRLTTYSLV
jgi:hypothetical protein